MLLTLSDAFGKDVGSGRMLIRQKVSQSDLAAMVGATRQSVNRALADLARDGLIQVDGRQITVNDVVALESRGGF